MRFLAFVSALAVVGMAAARPADSEPNSNLDFVRRGCDCDAVAACCTDYCNMDEGCCNGYCMDKYPECYEAC